MTEKGRPTGHRHPKPLPAPAYDRKAKCPAPDIFGHLGAATVSKQPPPPSGTPPLKGGASMGNKRGTFGASMGNDENTEIQSQSGFQRSYPHTTEETQEWEMDNITATLEACPELDPGGPANEKALV